MSRIGLSSAILAVAVSLLPSRAGAQVIPADAFVDSVGVNLHLHYWDTPYGDFSLVRSRLVESGVRHVRDGLIDTTWTGYYARYRSLGDAGIRGTFITGPEQSTELWASYPARMGNAFEAFEAPNELDRFDDPTWVHELTDAVVRLGTLRTDPRTSQFPVFGPSVLSLRSYARLGDLSAHFDAGNLHNYMGGRHPCTTGWGDGGYGSISWALDSVRPYAGGKPIVTTENGYRNDGAPDAVPLDVAGRYMPRLLLEQLRAGISRTYLYELFDWPGSERYGLLHPDGSRKPAFTAVKNLLGLLNDPGPAFTPQDLAYTVTGPADVRHMLFQKRNGNYFLALWRGVSSYDNTTREYLAVPPETVTVTLPKAMRVVQLHRWKASGVRSATLSLAMTATIPVSLADTLAIVELKDTYF